MPTKKKKEPKKEFNFKIGADPEFLILLHSTRLQAQTILNMIFEDTTAKEFGYDIKGGNIGWDGSAGTAELRPKPEKSPQLVVNNIHAMLKEFVSRANIFELTTLSKGAPTGGHIHLQNINNRPTQHIHNQVMSFYWPLMLGEDKINLYERLEIGYGKIEDFKEKNNNKTYELRVPSAEWLTTPKITNATLAYLATIWHEIHFNQTNLNKFKDIIHNNTKQGNAIQELALSEFQNITKYIITQIKRAIKTFEMYPAYKKEIDYIMNYKKVIQDKKDVQYNMLKGWKLYSRKQPNKQTILKTNTKQIETSKINLDTFYNMIEIPCNDDMNVSMYADTIKDKIFNLGWKLNNNYHLFGLRKGLNKYIATNFNIEFLKGYKLINTLDDFDVIYRIIRKMLHKWNHNHLPKNPQEINKITKTKENEKNIIIGIPYEDRQKRITKNLIELIYNIEKETNKKKTINIHNLINNQINEDKKTSIILKVYKKSKPTNEQPQTQTATMTDRIYVSPQTPNNPLSFSNE